MLDNMRLVSILWCMLGISGIGAEVTSEVDAGKIWEKFIEMEKCCLERLKQLIDKNEIKKKGQILCVNVLTAAEVNSDTFPNRSRTVSIPNKRRVDIAEHLPQRKDKYIHGEILAMYIEDTIEELIQNLTSSRTYHEGSIPYVFVYSKLIPCCGLEKWPYSCAEELAIYGRLNEEGRFNLLIGYNETYEHTNLTMTKRYLHQRGIFAIAHLLSKDRTVDMFTNGFTEPSIKVFQTQFHECVVKDGRFCGRGCDHCKDVKADVVFNRVNELVYYMVKEDKCRKRKTGPLTYLRMNIIKKSFVEQKWAKCCDEGKTEESTAMSECFDKIMEENYKDPDTLLILGKPYDDKWLENKENLGIEWDMFYKGYEPPSEIVSIKKSRETAGRHGARSREGSMHHLSRNVIGKQQFHFTCI